MNTEQNDETTTVAACPPLSAGLGIPSREQLVWALCEVLDGIWTWYDLQANTGGTQEECERLLTIRDAVKQQWVNSGMKMSNA